MDSMINKIQATSIQSVVRSFVRDEQGQDIVEYSLPWC